MQRLLQSLCLIFMTIAVASCGAINLAYNNASIFVASEFDDAFDLSAEQDESLQLALQDFFQWHRKSELPRYQQLLERTAVTIGDGISATEFQAIYDDLRRAARRSVARLIEDVAPLTATLTPKQIDHYVQYHRDKSGKYEDYLQKTTQQQEIFREQRTLKRLQEWFGKFDEIKRERIARQIQTLPDGSSNWIAFREARFEALLRALRAAPAEGLSSAELKFLLLDLDSEHAKAYEPARRAYWQEYARFMAELSPQLSASELRHAVERLEYYAEIVSDLQQPD